MLKRAILLFGMFLLILSIFGCSLPPKTIGKDLGATEEIENENIANTQNLNETVENEDAKIYEAKSDIEMVIDVNNQNVQDSFVKSHQCLASLVNGVSSVISSAESIYNVQEINVEIEEVFQEPQLISGWIEFTNYLGSYFSEKGQTLALPSEFSKAVVIQALSGEVYVYQIKLPTHNLEENWRAKGSIEIIKISENQFFIVANIYYEQDSELKKLDQIIFTLFDGICENSFDLNNNGFKFAIKKGDSLECTVCKTTVDIIEKLGCIGGGAVATLVAVAICGGSGGTVCPAVIISLPLIFAIAVSGCDVIVELTPSLDSGYACRILFNDEFNAENCSTEYEMCFPTNNDSHALCMAACLCEEYKKAKGGPYIGCEVFRTALSAIFKIDLIPFCGEIEAENKLSKGTCKKICGKYKNGIKCGDGICDANNETCNSCPPDCGTCIICGNKKCEAGENCNNCFIDCGTCLPICGNNKCESGENCISCFFDCKCGVGEVCLGNGICCKPKTCIELGKKCDIWPNGCDKNINCGSCLLGYNCENGKCVYKSSCGNEKCEAGAGENCSNCSLDCGACLPICGNNKCETGENPCNCKSDCSGCCMASDCPSCETCKEKICTNHVCSCKAITPCCGNGYCEAGEIPPKCPQDCKGCGDGKCESGENCNNCPSDCGICPQKCGNGKCETGENCSNCEKDCGKCCGNGKCDNGENCKSCPFDCGPCGDGNCCKAQNTPGCAILPIAACVCEQDPYCCYVAWDSLCVAEVEDFGCGICDVCNDECNLGEMDCFNYNFLLICGPNNNGCLKWDIFKCPDGYICSNGGCKPGTSACTPTEKKCIGNSVYQLDSCGWSTKIKDCASNQYCENKQCVSKVYCGNGVCDSGENCSNCPSDCGICPSKCGNGICDPNETPCDCEQDCPGCCVNSDCPSCSGTCKKKVCDENYQCGCGIKTNCCGNGKCESGENCNNCEKDCKCGTGEVCKNGECVKEEGENKQCSSCNFSGNQPGYSCGSGYKCFYWGNDPDKQAFCHKKCNFDSDCKSPLTCQDTCGLYNSTKSICYKNNVWYVDDCGAKMHNVECGDDEVCEDGKCKVVAYQCKPCNLSGSCGEFKLYEGYLCMHWPNNPDKGESYCIKQCKADSDCPTSSFCSGGACTESKKYTCYNGDVWKLDPCGAKIQKSKTCSALDKCYCMFGNCDCKSF